MYNQMMRDTTYSVHKCTWRNTDDRGQKSLLLIKSKDARRYRLRSPPMQSGAHPTIFRQNLVKILLKNLRQCDCSTFIRIIATIVQGFFVFYDDPRPKLIPDRSPTLCCVCHGMEFSIKGGSALFSLSYKAHQAEAYTYSLYF